VLAKFNFAQLYNKLGYVKETIAKGKFAEIFNDNRPFNDEEAQYFQTLAVNAYG
jgi:ClpP class serine protease